MKDVCVITGGGSGMGLYATLNMPKDKIIVISGRRASKLEKAVARLMENDQEEMNPGGVIVDIASNSAYILPKFLISTKTYALAETDENAFLRKSIKKSNLARGEYEKSGFAYALSKNFVVWYAQKCAYEYGNKGIRVCSVSPGPMSFR